MKNSKNLEDWCKFDLHHHTHNDTFLFDKNKSDRVLGLKEYDKIIDIFNQNNGRLLAITNHNKICNESIEEYKNYIKKNNYNITVLPGIELGFILENDNNKAIKIDLLIIFNENTSLDNIYSLNSKIFENENLYNSKTRTTKLNDLPKIVVEIYKIIKSDFIVIPHCNKGSSSIRNGLKLNEKIIEELPIFDFGFLESNNNSIENEKWNDDFLKKIKKWHKEYNYIFGTDAKNISDFEKILEEKVPWFNTNNNYEGIIDCINYKNRIKYQKEMPSSSQNNIEKIIFKDRSWIKLTPGINLILGRSGAGKSTLLTSITNYIKNGKDEILIIEEISYKNNKDLLDKDYFYLKQNHIKNLNFDDDEIRPLLSSTEDKHKNNYICLGKLLKEILKDKEKFIIIFNNLHKSNIEFYKVDAKNKKGKIKVSYQNNIIELLSKLTNENEIKLLKIDIENIENFINTNNSSDWLKFELKKIQEKLLNFSKLDEYIECENLTKLIKDMNEIFSKNISQNENSAKENKHTKKNLIDDINNFYLKNKEIESIINQIKEKTQKEITVKYKNDSLLNKELENAYYKVNYSLDDKQVLKSIVDIVSKNLDKNKILNSHNDLYDLKSENIVNEKTVKNKYKTFYTDKENFKEMKKEFFIGNKDILEESPGNRQQLYIKHAMTYNIDGKHLIILDQPEDNMDNKAISEVIIDDLLYSIGINKQIILISHDPKLILNCDVKNYIFCEKDENKTFSYKNIDKKELSGNDFIKLLDGSIKYPEFRSNFYKKNIEKRNKND